MAKLTRENSAVRLCNLQADVYFRPNKSVNFLDPVKCSKLEIGKKGQKLHTKPAQTSQTVFEKKREKLMQKLQKLSTTNEIITFDFLSENHQNFI